MTPEELLHIAYGELVEIEPMTAIPALQLLERTYSACGPLQIARVPLYAALLLKKANACKMRLPSYMALDGLRGVLAQEAAKTDEYSYIHPHFFSLAESLLSNCYNVENVEESRMLVERIRETRFRKTFEGMQCLEGRAVNLNNLTMFEFNEVRGFMLGSMRMGRGIEESR